MPRFGKWRPPPQAPPRFPLYSPSVGKIFVEAPLDTVPIVQVTSVPPTEILTVEV